MDNVGLIQYSSKMSSFKLALGVGVGPGPEAARVGETDFVRAAIMGKIPEEEDALDVSKPRRRLGGGTSSRSREVP